jgi:hypothetical protein
LWRQAAFDVAHSPSGCAIFCIAVGAMQIGEETRSPNTVVDVSILLTSTKILGINLILENASLFSLRVIISFAPDA